MGAFSRRPNRKSLSKKHNAGFRFEKCVMLPTSTQINTQTHPFMFFKQFFGFFGHMYMTVPILVIMVHFAARYNNTGHRQLVTWLVQQSFRVLTPVSPTRLFATVVNFLIIFSAEFYFADYLLKHARCWERTVLTGRNTSQKCCR